MPEPRPDISAREKVPVPENILRHIAPEHKPELAEIWKGERLKNLGIEEYVERIKNSGSGHLATHLTHTAFLDIILKRGYLVPTQHAYEISKEEGEEFRFEPTGQGRMVASKALHFSLDELYTRRGAVFLSAIESLLENKTIMGLPLDHIGTANDPKLKGTTDGQLNEMTVSGYSEDPRDPSNKFFIDELGVLLIPKHMRVYLKTGQPIDENSDKSWEQLKKEGHVLVSGTGEEHVPEATIEELVETLRKLDYPVPKRIYFYSAGTAEKGLREFLDKHGLTLPDKSKPITTSGDIVFSHRNGVGGFTHFSPDGEGLYFKVAKSQ